MKNKKWFSLIELIIVIGIIWILATIWYVSFSGNLIDWRNTKRISDISNVMMSLNSHKQEFGLYPIPWNRKSILNSWTWIINQWYLDNEVSILNFTNIPKDPLTKNNYIYSTTQNRHFFQIWLSLELHKNELWWNIEHWFKAYIDWNYQQIHTKIPSLMISNIEDNFEISTHSWAYIINWWTLNLPYTRNNTLVKWSENLDEILSEKSISISKFMWFSSCEDIKNNNRLMWSWSYYIENLEDDC